MTTATENIRFICDSCGFRARIPGSYKGKVILCPGCQAMKIVAPDGSDPTGSTVAVRRVETATVPTGTFSNPDAAGKIRFTCSKCGYLAKLGANYAGKAIACPSCESPQLIPPLAPAAVAAPKAEIELALDLGAPNAATEAAAKPAPTPAAPAAAGDGDLSLDEPETQAKPDLSDELAPVSPPADLPTGLADEPAATVEPGKPATKPQVRGGRPGTPAAPAPRTTPRTETPAAAGAPPTKPKTGSVVRRGGRPDDEEEDAESADEDDGTDTPPAKPLVAVVAAGKLVTVINKLPVLYVTIVAVVSTVLMLTFLFLWRGSAGEAADWQKSADHSKDQFDKESKAHRNTELQRQGVTSELKDAKDKLEAALAAGKKTEDERATAESESQTAKAEAESERTQRKAAEGKLDAALGKAAKAESERDEAVRQFLEKAKALKEETAMRKQFQDRVKELDAKTK